VADYVSSDEEIVLSIPTGRTVGSGYDDLVDFADTDEGSPSDTSSEPSPRTPKKRKTTISLPRKNTSGIKTAVKSSQQQLFEWDFGISEIEGKRMYRYDSNVSVEAPSSWAALGSFELPFTVSRGTSSFSRLRCNSGVKLGIFWQGSSYLVVEEEDGANIEGFSCWAPFPVYLLRALR
jgi:hypothetical protein